MRNCKAEVLKALVAAMQTALPGMIVRSKMTAFDKSTHAAAYPYVYVTQIIQNEQPCKPFYLYDVEALIQVTYIEQSTLEDMYQTVNTILRIFKLPKPFELENDFEIIETTLLANADDEQQTESGIYTFALIRVRFEIQDKQI